MSRKDQWMAASFVDAAGSDRVFMCFLQDDEKPRGCPRLEKSSVDQQMPMSRPPLMRGFPAVGLETVLSRKDALP